MEHPEIDLINPKVSYRVSKTDKLQESVPIGIILDRLLTKTLDKDLK